MGICLDEIRELVIRPTLRQLHRSSAGMENLLLGTAAQESEMGLHLKYSRRRGLGIYQIPPQSHKAVWDRYLVDHPALASKVRGLASQRDFLEHPHAELTTNLRYATAIAWLVYRAAGISEIAADDIYGMARAWHRHFHHGPSATISNFIDNYFRYVEPKKDRACVRGLPRQYKVVRHPAAPTPPQAPTQVPGQTPGQAPMSSQPAQQK